MLYVYPKRGIAAVEFGDLDYYSVIMFVGKFYSGVWKTCGRNIAF